VSAGDGAGPPTAFTVTTTDDGRDVVLRLAGELDLGSVARFAAAAEPHVASRRFVVDVAAVTFIDSSGLGALVDLATRAREGGGTVVLAHPDQRILRLLELTALDRVFDIVHEPDNESPGPRSAG
jgi:anti-sigma B factor antagonist